MSESVATWDHTQILASAEVVLFCKDDCAFCERAKDLAQRECTGNYRVVDISFHLREQTPGFEDYYEMVRQTTQARTVPIVFYHGKYVGGFEELRNQLLFSLSDF